jgi:hypothetical protein
VLNSQLRRVTHQRRDFVPLVQRLLHQKLSGASGCANDQQFHGGPS